MFICLDFLPDILTLYEIIVQNLDAMLRSIVIDYQS